MPLCDEQASHLSNSVILLVSASKMVRIYLFTSSLVPCRRIEARTCLRLSIIAMFLKEPSRCCSDRFIRSVNTVERKIQKVTILNRK